MTSKPPNGSLFQKHTNFTGRIPVKNSCPKCSGKLHFVIKELITIQSDTLKCDSCEFLESTADNIKRNATYYINGVNYTQDEAKRLNL